MFAAAALSLVGLVVLSISADCNGSGIVSGFGWLIMQRRCGEHGAVKGVSDD